MTVKTAIEVLQYYVSNSEHYEATRIAIAALEKQIPKKPTHEETLQRCNTCPCCCQVIDTKVYEEFGNGRIPVRYERCVFCGQAIDWSDE